MCHFIANVSEMSVGQRGRLHTSRLCKIRPCLVLHPKIFHPSHRIFRHMHGTLNVDKKVN